MTTSSKSRTVAFLLSFFLGAFGAHRFYAGRGGSGVVMLILTITLIGAIVSGIWNLVDIFTIGFGNFKDGEGYTISKW